MNVSMIQTLQPAKTTGGQVSEAVKSGVFGTVLAQSMSVPSLNSNKQPETVSIDEQLHSLLELLQIEDLQQLENSQQLSEELLFVTQEQQLPVIFEYLGHLFSSESIAELQSLLSELTSLTSGETDLLGQLSIIVNQDNVSLQRMVPADDAIKLAKIYTLFRNVLDLSEEQVVKLDDIKQKMEQIASKLENLLVPKEKVAFEKMLNRNSATGFASYVSNTDYTFKTQTASQSVFNSNSDSTVAGINNPFMNMSKLEQFVLNTQMGEKGTVNSDQLLKSFENMLSKAQFTNQNGLQKLFIKLNPEHLGSLRIEIIQQNGTMIAKIIASTQQARELLDSQLQGLKQAFVNQNIPVEKLELSQQFSDLTQERHLTREQGKQQGEGKSSSDKSQEDDQVLEQFQLQFEEALLEAKGAGDSYDFN